MGICDADSLSAHLRELAIDVQMRAARARRSGASGTEVVGSEVAEQTQQRPAVRRRSW
jgi:hypothetical protein